MIFTYKQLRYVLCEEVHILKIPPPPRSRKIICPGKLNFNAGCFNRHVRKEAHIYTHMCMQFFWWSSWTLCSLLLVCYVQSASMCITPTYEDILTLHLPFAFELYYSLQPALFSFLNDGSHFLLEAFFDDSFIHILVYIYIYSCTSKHLQPAYHNCCQHP